MFKTQSYKLEQNIGSTFSDVGLGDDFLYLTSKAKNKQVRLHEIEKLLQGITWWSSS